MSSSYSNQDGALSTRVLLVSQLGIPDTVMDGWREQCRMLAEALGGPLELWRLDGASDGAVQAALRDVPAAQREVIEAGPSDIAAPMSAAPFVWRPDGRPDWAAMWTTFCELALFGGPPHRGPDEALEAVPNPGPAPGEPDAVAEIRRGIWETTGLYAE